MSAVTQASNAENNDTLKTIAFFNVKGGVGKTTSAVNFAYEASKANAHTLLWDLDPQSCASWYLGVSDVQKHKAIRVFKGKEPVGTLRLQTAFPHLEVIPADLSLRKLEMVLSHQDSPRKLLDRLTDHLSEHRKLLIFDCAPAFSQVSESVFSCSDLLMVPLLPSPLSLRSFQQLQEFLTTKKAWRKLEILPFFTMVDRRRKIHNEVIENARSLVGMDKPLTIPYTSDLEKMGLHQQPVNCFAKSSPADLAYQQLWRYVAKRYQLL